jgi:hypothetical protein
MVSDLRRRQRDEDETFSAGLGGEFPVQLWLKMAPCPMPLRPMVKIAGPRGYSRNGVSQDVWHPFTRALPTPPRYRTLPNLYTASARAALPLSALGTVLRANGLQCDECFTACSAN